MRPRPSAAPTRGRPRRARCARCARASASTRCRTSAKYRRAGPRRAGLARPDHGGPHPAPGRLSLSPMLSPQGARSSAISPCPASARDFQLTASYGAQDFHMRWFEQHPPQGDGVMVENISDRRTGFQIAGPRARDVLQAVHAAGCVGHALHGCAQLTIGLTDGLVQRVSYTGDLGYEIYVDAMEQRALWAYAVGGGPAVRHETLRHARDDEPAARPVLRLLDAGVFARLHRRRDRARPVHHGRRTWISSVGRRPRRSVRQGLRASCATSSWRPETPMSWPMRADLARAGIRTMRGCLSRWGASGFEMHLGRPLFIRG
jgi:hypothetical protein